MAKKETPSRQVENSQPKQKRRLLRGIDWGWLLAIAVLLCAFAGGYLYILLQSANKATLGEKDQKTFVDQIGFYGERLIIPKIGLDEKIESGDSKVLDSAVWHRYPDRGDPENGGNMILSGHRYVFAWLPHKVSEVSRFYNLDKVSIGDKVFVNWQGQQYEYEVSEVLAVKPSETKIEEASAEAKLTIYTCTLGGEADGRITLIAKPKKSR